MVAHAAAGGTRVDDFLGRSDHLRLVLGVVQTLDERRAGHAVGSDGTAQTVFFQHRPVVRTDQFHAPAAEFFRRLTGLFQRPFLFGILKTPEHHRLVDVALANAAAKIQLQAGAAACSHRRGSEGRSAEHAPAA